MEIDKRKGTSEGACEGRKDGSLDSFTDEMSLGSADGMLDGFIDDGDEGVLVHSNMALWRLSNMTYSLP